MTSTKTEGINPKAREVDFQWFIVEFFSYWQWFCLSVIVFLLAGYIYLRYSVAVYEVTSKIAVKDSRKGGLSNTELSFYETLGFLQANSIVENEMKVLGSRNLIESVVLEKEFFIKYIVKGRIKDTELYGNSNPFYSSTPIRVFANQQVISSLRSTIVLRIMVEDNSTIRVKGSYGSHTFESAYASLPGVLNTPIGELLLLPGETTVLNKDYPLEVRISPPLRVAQRYGKLLNIELTDRNTTIVALSLRETHKKRGEDFLQALVDLYNRDTMAEKNKAARTASDFIEERLQVLNKDLQEAEKEVDAYKRDNYIASILVESEIAVSEDNIVEKKVVRLETQKIILSYLLEELNKETSQIIHPLGSGTIADVPLSELIQKYNACITERARLLNLVTPDAPIIKRQEEQIASLRMNIRESINGLMYALNKETDEYMGLGSKYSSEIKDLPRRERELENLERAKTLKAELYIALFTQRENIDLTLAVTAPSATVLEYPLASSYPVSPNRFIIYILSLIGGVLFPFLVIALREMMNFKLSQEIEVNRFSDVPIIISFPYVKKTKEGILITPNATTPMVERFRLLRTNLQFIFGTERQSILLTSTVSGEGKTFISMNLAATFALKYKTLLVGLDIRRPKMNTYLGLPNRKGLISYLLKEESDIDKLIVKNVNGSNLDILVSGPVPPNPNELLIEKTLDDLFAALRQRYEYIIIDSSPVGSVSDAFLLKRISDVSLFVMRGGLTPKSAISLVNNIYKEKRLNNLKLVLNGFNAGKHQGYGYDYGYGYGYGYGYESKN
ncbi:MAG: polysaccharide biosynthesis tyrosine autokinase [Dysgonamonadaceae bacterium]|jgi:capsular exopolysaccharide synthesis family protein|nr:polysaccharide biosynthesis tyrosine autokinase [Dysgonamonadaceae bacterium]